MSHYTCRIAIATIILAALLRLAACATQSSAQLSTRPSTQPTFDITKFGAVGDGKTSCTAAFRAAIDAVKQAGGGTVHVPAGKFFTGPIDFVDNMTLDIDKDGTILFTTNKADYPTVYSRWEGIMTNGPRPLLWADGVHHIAITGLGTIDGQGSTWWGGRGVAGAGSGSLGAGRGSGAGGVPAGKPDADLGRTPATQPSNLPATSLRPPLCQIKDCTDIHIGGVTFTQSPFWTLHLLFSDNITLDKTRMVNPSNSPNTDACDIDSCRHVNIDGCYADVGDDSFCIKSGRDADGRRVNRPTQDVTVTHCTVGHGHGGIVIGSETSGGVSHIRCSDCTWNGTDNGVRIKSMRGRGGLVEDVVISNITMTGVKTAFLLTSQYQRTQPAPVSETTPILRDVHIDHITADNVTTGLSFEGLAEMPISNVSFSDITITAQTAGSAQYGKDIAFTRFSVTSSRSPTITMTNMENVTKTDYVEK